VSRSKAVTKLGFSPIVDASTRLLILGSLPGDASLLAGRYYASPRNQFWQLVGPLVDCDLSGLEYDARLSRLLRGGIGLWDVLQSAERAGSGDARIRRPVPNPLAALAARLPELRAIAFNGGTAARLGRPALPREIGLALVTLPSSSPAHAVPVSTKAAAWSALARLLD
jgi:double-stranded uracil-DNA glycosylase